MISSKKADSHLEMIISFSMFLLFVIFLFTYLSPIKQPDISSSLLKSAEAGVEKYSTTMLNIPAILNQEKTGCFKIQSPFTETSNSKIFVRDESGSFPKFYADASGITIEGNNKKLYYLYHIQDASFQDTGLECTATEMELPETYSFSIPRIKSVYLKSELIRLKEKYDSDYEGLKEEFEYPKTSDFAVFFKTATGQPNDELSMSVNKPEKVVVNAKELPILILEEISGIKKEVEATINIQVW